VPVKAEVKSEVKEDTSDEAYSKDFHKITSIKLTSRGEALYWYDNLPLRGAMYGIFVPTSHNIALQSIMGTFWSKKLMGDTIHGRRSTIKSHLYKLLMSDGVFTTDCREEYLGIVKATCGDGYAALHNILRLHRPRLTNQIIEIKYPPQNITMRFGEHVKFVEQYMDHESMRGRHYTRYEALQVVLCSLHINFRVALTERSIEEFGGAHDRLHTIPFAVQMSQLGTSLSGWTKELGLHTRATPRVTFLDENQDSEI
jgi:hypothetical protein